MVQDEFTPEQKLNYDLRHYPVRPHVGVGGIIIWKDSVLIVKRKYMPNAGFWAIPGGHLKLGEPAAIGALRECQEETGLKLEIDHLASVIDKIDVDATGKVEYHYVLCDYWLKLSDIYSESNLPLPFPASDVLEAKFVSFSELPNYNLTRTVIQLFKDIKVYPENAN